jgi:hypothetical protein
MFLLAAELPSGSQCLALCYPGIIPGNGPSINSRGMVHTCNYIGGKEWRHGVPRYFLNRAMLDARDMDDALGFASHPFRAYSQAHNLVSIPEKRALMVESSVNKLVVRELNGVFTRTNHYVFPEMATEPEFKAYPKKSGPRLAALNVALGKTGSAKISSARALTALSSHRNRPLSPCRHRNPKVKGATLGMFLFDSDVPGFRFYHGAPCRKISRRFQPAWARWIIDP